MNIWIYFCNFLFRFGLKNKVIVTLSVETGASTAFLDEIIEIVPLIKNFCLVILFQAMSDEEEASISSYMKGKLVNTIMLYGSDVGKLAMVRQLGVESKIIAHLDSNSMFISKVQPYSQLSLKYDRYPSSFTNSAAVPGASTSSLSSLRETLQGSSLS